MSFPAYPKYKDSGAEWLGDIPIEWDVPALRRTVGLITEKAEGSGLSVGLEDIMGWSGRYDPKGADYESDGTAFNCGDVLYGKLRPYLAKVWAANTAGAAVGDFHVLRPTQITSSFLVYCLLTPAAVSILDGATHGAKMPRVSWGALADLRLPLPSTREQLSITAFLDRETAKIDAAVAAQERLIALLAEKRAATISHAVTKGLDPDAPRKDSGIEWLGQIPAHWSVQKIGWKLDAKPRYGVLVPDDDPDGVPMLRIKDLTAEVTDTSSLMTISADLSDQYPNTVVEVGDMLLSVVGTIGSTRIVGPQLAGVNLSRALARLRPSDTVYTSYLRWIFQSLPFTQYVDLTCVGTAQRVLNMDDLSALRFAFPTIEEQRKISEELDRAVGRFDDLINRARAAMELLKERRAALISDAVTGKIDVRGEVNAQEQEAA